MSIPLKSSSDLKFVSTIGVFKTDCSYGPGVPQGVFGQAFTVDGVMI